MSKNEMITLPREVIERALAALDAEDPYRAAVALRAALEQSQVVRETAPNGATHIQPQQGAFYKRVDEKWYVWSHMEDGCPHRWYISPGTVESCLKQIYAATERLQNHVPDAGNMVQAGWKPVPVEPTEEMLRAGCGSESPAMFRESLRRETDGQKTVEMVEKIIQRNLNSYRAMLAAAPQPQVDPEPVTLLRFNTWSSNEGDSWYDCPTDAQIIEDVFGGETPVVGTEYEVSAGWHCVTATYRITWVSEDGDCEAECISHKQENFAPQPDPAPYLYYDPENGDTWTQEAINDGCCLPDGLIALYTK